MDTINGSSTDVGPFSDFVGSDAWPQSLHRYAPALTWLRKNGSGEQSHVSLPSDLFLITVYCDEHLQCGPGGEEKDLHVVVSALRTKPVHFHSSGGGELAVALLTPLGLLQALRAPLEETTDRRVPLATFVGWAAQRALRDALLTCHTPAERLQRLAGWLEQRIRDSASLVSAPKRVAAAAMQFYDTRGEAITIAEVAGGLQVGRRQLERDFRRWLGVSPNTYARLVRFQRAVTSVTAGQELIQVAAQHGYADQSHMTREFREMALTTPRKIARLRHRHASVRLQSALAGRLIVVPPTDALIGTGSTRLHDTQQVASETAGKSRLPLN